MKVLFGEISGANSKVITVWRVQKTAEVESPEEALKMMQKNGFGGFVIPSLLEPGVQLRIAGVNLTVAENPVPKPRNVKEHK